MNNGSLYENHTLNKNKLFSFLLFVIIMFFVYLFVQFQIKSLAPFYKAPLLYVLFIFNILTIKYIVKRTKLSMTEIIFSDINIYLNEKNRKINFSQKNEIKNENKSGFNFYITLTSNDKIKDRKKIKNDLDKKVTKLFNNFLFDSAFDNIMSKEHWFRVLYATFLYFILFILLLEMIDIGKEIFDFGKNEIFFIFILFFIFSDLIGKLKNIPTKVLFIFFFIIFFIFKDYKVIFNQNYSITLMLLSLFILLYITSILINIIKADTESKSIIRDDLDTMFLIDMYFNRKFLYMENNKLPKKVGMQKELFYALIGFLFTISVPIIIEEVKIPFVNIDKNKGQSIEQIRE